MSQSERKFDPRYYIKCLRQNKIIPVTRCDTCGFKGYNSGYTVKCFEPLTEADHEQQTEKG